MTLFKRRLLYLTFFLLFALIAPVLILFVNGYRFDWGNKTLYKTGLLIAEYLPKDATLVIDEVKQATKSPTRVSGLVPRNYELRIEKNGYFPWEKRLWIPEYTTTFVRHVNLFKKTVPTHIDATLDQFVAHPEQPIIAMARKTTNGIRIEQITTQSTIAIPDLPTFTEIQTLQWSRHGKWLLVIGKSNGRTITRIIPSVKGSPIIALEKLVTSPLTTLTWDATYDDQLAGYEKTGKATMLFTINIQKESVGQSILPEQSFGLPFILDRDHIIILSPNQDAGTTLIFRPLLPSGKAIEQRVTIPAAAHDLRILEKQEHLITILDTKTKQVYLVEREPRTNPPVTETFSNVTGASWSPNGRRFIYWNSQEIFLWDLERNTKERIARSEEPIAMIFWHPSNEYIFIQTKNALSVLEIDGRDHRNLVPLVTEKSIGGAAVDQLGQWLAIWNTATETAGVDWYELR